MKKKRSSTSKDDKEFKPEVVSDAGDDIELTEEEERVRINNRTRMLPNRGCISWLKYEK